MGILSPVERAVIAECVYTLGDLGFYPLSVSLCDRHIEGIPDETRAASCALSVVDGIETLASIFDIAEFSLNLRGPDHRQGEERDAWLIFIPGNGCDILHDWSGPGGMRQGDDAIFAAVERASARFET